MKKYIFFCISVMVLSQAASAQNIIRRDFYLNGREFATVKENVTILPNTLRLTLSEGDCELLRADVLPDNELSELLLWRLREKNGVAEIFPSGKTCAVYGVSAGRESVEISLDGEGSVSVEIDVSPPKEIRLRSFENAPETEEKTHHPEKTFPLIVRGLLICSALLILSGSFFLIRQRRRDDDEG